MMIKFSWLRVLLGCSSFVLTSSKCLVKEPQGVSSPSLHGDSGFALAINSNPEYYEEHNLYTITLKVSSNNAKGMRRGVSVAFALPVRKVLSSNLPSATHFFVGVFGRTL